jgi:hypothetical protein
LKRTPFNRAVLNKLQSKSQSIFLSRVVFYFVLIAFSLIAVSCKTSRKTIKSPLKEYGADYLFTKLKENELKFEWVSAKFNLDLIIDKKKTSVTGQVRMKKDSVIWVTLSPALGIEMARLVITTDSVKFINRINKTYFTGDYAKVCKFLDANIDYDIFQTLLLGNDLTYYEDGKFRATYDSKEYHLVTAGRQKLRKYVKTREDEERIYIQNIFLDPETFKITLMKIKEVKKENKKLDATYSEFQPVSGQLFPHHILYDLLADKPIQVDLRYAKIEIDQHLEFPFKISDKYDRIQ